MIQGGSSLRGSDFCEAAFCLGYNFFTGVPDSTLASAFKALENDPRYGYVGSVREDNAVGVAVGAYLGGRQPAVLMQSSGLGHCIDALTSLASLYRIPVLLIIGWRGECASDAPEHRLMGSALPGILRVIGISFWSPDRDQLSAALRLASSSSISECKPTALLIKNGIIE